MLLVSTFRNFVHLSKLPPSSLPAPDRNIFRRYLALLCVSRCAPASVVRQFPPFDFVHLSTAPPEGVNSKKRGRKKMPVLTEQERKELLDPLLLKEWTVQENRDAIYKEFKFKDFKQAFKFMTAVADKADEMDHHPEWFNVYNKVNITLSTHDCNGLSKRDIKLANIIEENAANIK